MAKGLTNKEIVEELHLSEYTAKNHMSRILKQLDAENRSEAVRHRLSGLREAELVTDCS